jgi:uncharacterized OB-fold protein
MNQHRQSKRLDPMSTRNTDWFWDEAAQGRLSIQKCSACGHLHHPPRPVCPDCHSTELAPAQMSGRGTLYSFMQVHYPPPLGFDEPPIIALIDLEEGGVRLISNVVDAALDELVNDAPVVVDFEKTAKGKTLPVFRLAERGAGA